MFIPGYPPRKAREENQGNIWIIWKHPPPAGKSALIGFKGFRPSSHRQYNTTPTSPASLRVLGCLAQHRGAQGHYWLLLQFHMGFPRDIWMKSIDLSFRSKFRSPVLSQSDLQAVERKHPAREPEAKLPGSEPLVCRPPGCYRATCRMMKTL